jgi:serpin B
MVEPPAGTLSAEVHALVDGWSRFAVDLYRQLVPAGEAAGAGNLVASPSSVATVLAMVLPGARGATADEIATVLRTGLDAERVAGAAGSLDSILSEQAEADELDLRLSNAVWTQAGLPLNREFERVLTAAFRAGLREVDFVRDPEAARRAINRLVAEQTAGKITQLFEAGAIDAKCRLVLTSAIYLQARWLHAFDPSETRPEPFHRPGGAVDVPMLHRQGRVEYGEGEGWRAVELPYRGGRMVMDVVVPEAGTFERFSAGLDAGRLGGVLASLETREVRLALPKFRFDSDLDLAAPLMALGMRAAFSNGADFSGITERDRLRIDRVVQRAHVEVDERGTTAAAATGTTMRLVSMVAPSRPIELRVDRPFLFAVRDRTTGVLLFLGQVADPSSS